MATATPEYGTVQTKSFDGVTSDSVNIAIDEDKDGPFIVVFVPQNESSDQVDSVTIGGQSATEITGSPATQGDVISGWYLYDPPRGASVSVDVNFSTSTEGGIIAATAYNIATSSAIEADEVATGTGATSDSITTVSDNSLIFIGAFHGEHANTVSFDNGETEIADFAAGDGLTTRGVAGYLLKASAGAQTVGFTSSAGNDDWGMISIALKPFTPPAKEVFRLSSATLPTTIDRSDYIGQEYSASEITDIGTDDGTRVTQEGNLKYNIHYGRIYNSNDVDTDEIDLDTDQQSSVATSTQTAHLQVYNHNTPGWEGHDSDSATAADTDFGFSWDKTSGMEDYYDSLDRVHVRIYQDTGQ